MSVLAYIKYPVWTMREYIVSPRRALRNTRLALAIFWRTFYLGVFCGVIRTLKSHVGGQRAQKWSERTRGRYIWRVAQRFWARWSLEKLGVHLSHSGLEHVDWSRPHILVSNHQSSLDILFMVALVPNGRFVAKKEVLFFPVIGDAVCFGGQIVVDRGNHEQAMQAVRTGMETWPDSNLIFFAESTRTRDGKLQPFKRGAFVMARDTGIPILPVAIIGAFEALPKGSLLRFATSPRIHVAFGSEILVSRKALVEDIIRETRHAITKLMRNGAHPLS